MASSVTFTFSSLIYWQLSSFHPCKNPSIFEFQLFPRSPTLSGSPSFALRPHFSSIAKLPATEQLPVKSKTFGTRRKSTSGSRSLGLEDDSLDRKNLISSLVNDKTRNGSVQNGSLRLSGDGNVKKFRKSCELESPDVRLRVALDQCSKRADFEGALDLYDLARKEGVRLGQYHYNVLLYLCSSAAVGVVQPAKSGSGSRRLNSLELSRGELSDNESVNSDQVGDVSDGDSSNDEIEDCRGGERVIRLSEHLKEYALKRGFEIYEEMRAEKVPMNEASLTSVARMAMSMGDGDMAFDTVKQMISLGINPRLRSYGPALSVFCNSRDVKKAFQVENHMLEHGVYPEEPELEALLRVSVEAGKGDKVYYVLQKLRTSVRKVSPSTAELIEKWFKSSAASKLGKRKLDQKIIREVIQNCGGGWHGQGWLGKGKWNVSRGSVGDDGSCKCCGEKLALIDLDPKETENFAKSVASIATKRERNLSFQKFQKWLDYYGPFEAVIDAANVGLFSQQRFLPSKVNAVVNGIRQKLPSRRWPLIVLHNRRITGPKMNEPVNSALIDKWRNADALYATPTGSNDDWYWLYAAIKFKCLIVTNDEMRDHTFQLLGNDFFPKWKERHQVRFGFSDAGPVFHMPPSYSIVIQESENGHWHIPIAAEDGLEADRTWLCVTRPNSRVVTQLEGKATEIGDRLKLEPAHQANGSNSINPSRGTYDSLRSIFSASVYSSESTILPELEAAENIGNCTIDFQI